jgi:hypothetical protein
MVVGRKAVGGESFRIPAGGMDALPTGPRGIVALQFFATVALMFGMEFVTEGFRDRHVYDAIPGLPFVAIVSLVGVVVPLASAQRPSPTLAVRTRRARLAVTSAAVNPTE